MFKIGKSSGAVADGSYLILRLLKAFSAFVFIGFRLAGCATGPKEYPRNPSTAFAYYTTTSLGQLFSEAEEKHPGESGFAIIRQG